MQNIDPTAPEGAQGAQSGVSEADAASNADIDALTQQLAQAEAAVAEMRDVMLRERAELENQRRRLLQVALREGTDLTLKTLLRVAETNGLKPVDPTGQPFNPDLHQAMSMVDSPGHASGSVVATLQKGYVLNDRLLRPALVAVAK